MLIIKIGKNQKMIISVNGEDIHVLSDKNTILSILANKNKVSIKREKMPILEAIVCEDTIANPQEKEQN